MADPIDDRLRDQRRALPDAPGVYLFKDADGRVLYVGKAKSIRKRVGSHFSEPLGPRGGRDARRGSSRSTSSRPRTRPRRCSPSSASSSSTGRRSTSACATTSRTRTSASRSTSASRASTSRASATAPSAPTSARSRARSACARRSTCSASSSRTAPATAPSRAARRAARASTTTSSAARRPASTTSPRQDYRANIEAIIRFLSGPLPADRARARAARWRAPPEAQEFEQAAVYRNRLRAVRSLFERQRVASGTVGTLDVVARRRRRHGRERAGVPGARRRARRPPELLPREPRRPQRGRGRGGVRDPVLRDVAVDPGGDRRAGLAGRGRRSCGRRSRSGARRRSSCATRSAARSGACTSWPSATRGSRSSRTSCARERRRQQRVDALNDLREALGHGRAAGADRGLRHLEPRPGAHRRVDGRVRGRRAAQVRLPPLQDPRARRAARTTSPRCRRCLRRRMAQWLEQRERSPHDPDARRELRGAAGADRDRRRAGASSRAACAALEEFMRAGRRRWSASPSGSRRSTCPGRARADRAAARLARAAAAPADPRRGAPVRDRAPPQPPRPLDEDVGPRRAAGHRARPASARCCATSARRSASSARRARSSRRCRAYRARSRGRSTSS